MYTQYVYNDETFTGLYTGKDAKEREEKHQVIGRILALINKMIEQITTVIKDHNNREHKQVVHHLNMDNVGKTTVRLQENFFYIDLSKIAKCFIYICKILYVLDNNEDEIIKRLNSERKEINIHASIIQKTEDLLSKIKKQLIKMLNGLATIYTSVNVIETSELAQAISDMIRDYYNMSKTMQEPKYPVIPETDYKLFQKIDLYYNYKMKRKYMIITINNETYLLILDN
jgi:hypothetical protein